MSEEKVIGKIYETKDYDRFKIIKTNRDLDKKHVTKLKGMIRKGDKLQPANISPDDFVQDGQHRLQAAKEENAPFRYYIGEKLTAEQIAAMNNTTKRWVNDDYAKAYAKVGNENYKVYKAFRTRFPDISHACAIILLQNSSCRSQKSERDFREGHFVVENETKAIKLANKLMEIKEHTDVYSRVNFILAILRIMETIKGFDIDRLISKLNYKANLVRDYAQRDDFIRVLEQVYNWKEPAENKLRLFDIT